MYLVMNAGDFRAPYAQLRRNVRILGIYDDHDYGENNAGREFGLRDASQRALLDTRYHREAPDRSGGA